MEPNPRAHTTRRTPTARPRPGPRAHAGGSAVQAATAAALLPSATAPGSLPPAGADMLDIAGALQEIASVPAAAIHRAAAYQWASRAIAGYRTCLGHAAPQEALTFLYLGEHYREAALAHAAMGEAWQPLYSEIDRAMAKDRAQAFGRMRDQAAERGR